MVLLLIMLGIGFVAVNLLFNPPTALCQWIVRQFSRLDGTDVDDDGT